MADELNPQETLPGVTPGATPPATPVYNPDEVEGWKAAAERYNSLAAQLGPYSDDIQKLVENEEYRNFYRQSWQAFEDAKKRNAPQISDELKPIVEQFKPVADYVTELRDRERKYNEQQNAAYISEQQSFARKLMADHNVDADFIEDLAAIAIQKKTNLEGAWNRLNSKFRIEKASTDAPPTSLRGDAANPGVPGKSAEAPPSNDQEFRAMLRKRAARALKEAQGA